MLVFAFGCVFSHRVAQICQFTHVLYKVFLILSYTVYIVIVLLAKYLHPWLKMYVTDNMK